MSALAFGYAALTRPVYGALALALAGLLLVLPRAAGGARLARRDAARGALVVVAGWLIVLGGTAFVNYAQFGRFGLGPSVGLHLCTKTMTFVERLPDDLRCGARDPRPGAGRGTGQARRAPHGHAGGVARSGGTVGRHRRAGGRTAVLSAAHESRAHRARADRVSSRRGQGDGGLLVSTRHPLSSMRSSVLRWTWGVLHGLIVSCFFAQVIVLAGVGLFEASKWAAGVRDRAWCPGPAPTGPRCARASPEPSSCYAMLLSCFLDIGDPRQRRPTDMLVVFLCVLGPHVWHRSVRAAAQRERHGERGGDWQSGRQQPWRGDRRRRGRARSCSRRCWDWPWCSRRRASR
ncbi:MAG: hypothetical protein MZV49_25195 [Rhodopseudomonas palustris]|nr:hypothetical protein [Rhodopseudomonas palustris]